MMTDQPAFVPVLTVMVDYGGAPFLWLKESPDEPGVSIHRNSIDTGKMRRSSLDPTFLLA